MRAIVDHLLLEQEGVDPLALASLFQHGASGRHRIIVEPGASDALEAWGERVGREVFERCSHALELSLVQEALEPSEHSVRVSLVAESDWTTSPPILSLEDAQQFLGRTFNILVEDVLSDREFLLSVASPEIRRDLRRRAEKGWITFDNGGGITNVARRVRELLLEPRETRLWWVISDSDAVAPGCPSRDSETLRLLCGASIGHHQLRRRAAENYLPVPALLGWADRYSPTRLRPAKKRLARAYSRLSAVQRWHYNMKGGFEGDRRHADSELAAAQYGDVSDRDLSALSTGFGSAIASLFVDLQGSGQWGLFQRDRIHVEFTPVFQRLMRAMR